MSNNKLLNNKPEILAPAGDLSTAIRAFEAGADAVYLGLKDFSARKGAVNFDFSELRRLKNYCLSFGKAFYVTLNTIVQEDEFEAMHACLTELELIGPDALIIQDLGLLHFIKKFFPKLIIHASTQMAIHNSSGLQMAKALGIERVVLSRELSFEQIKNLREAHPDIELEVFIHGALCYSFSGLCLASGLLLNRSGNRGMCAQLCRNFYRIEGDESYPFSCNDLALHEEVIKLAKIGIHSFKIEGRLKSKEYVQSTVRLYRSLLKGEEKQSEVLKKEAALNFARKQSTAYFSGNSGTDLIDPLFPGHRGIPLGVIEKVKDEKFSFTPQNHVEKNDTLLILNTEGKFTRFTAFQLRQNKNEVEVQFQDDEGQFVPQIGDQLFLIHSTKQVKVAEIDYKTITEAKHPLKLKCFLKNQAMCLECTLPSGASSIWDIEATIQEAKGDKDFTKVFSSIFKEAGPSPFFFSKVELINESGFEKIFIPLSQLKKIKNSFYERIDQLQSSEQIRRWKEIQVLDSIPTPPTLDLTSFQNRMNLGPHENIPFAHLKDLLHITSFKSVNGFRVIPLLPVLPDESAYFEYLEKLISDHPNEKFLIGLSNLAHLAWAKKYQSNKNLAFFADFYIYNANHFSLELIKEEIPSLLFAYHWVEKETELFNSPVPLIETKDKNKLPYFISLGCFEKHNVFKGKCPTGCGKRYAHSLKNGPNSYQVLVRDCITYMRISGT